MVYDAEAQKAKTLQRMGADLRAMREEAGLSLEQVANHLWPGVSGRDRISKVERGISSIDITALLELLWYLRTYVANKQHPGILLAARWLSHENRKSIEPDC